MGKVRSYVVKGKQIYVGLEDAKRTWKVSVRCEGMEVHFTSMPAQYPVLREYLQQRFPECTIELVYEAGFRGFWLHDLLQADGVKCIVAPPSRVTQARCSSRKNDTVDARRLGTILEKQDVPACTVPDQERREDRQISRTLLAYQDDIVRTQNRIRKLMDFHGVGEDLPAGAWGTSEYETFRVRPLPPMLAKVRDALFATLDHLGSVGKELHAELKVLSRKERYASAVTLLSSAPGVGWRTAIRLVLEWGEDWSRFHSAKHMASYAGLVASEYSTGESERKGRITGDSSPHVRGWLVQCSWSAIRQDPVLQDKFRRVWRNSGSKKKAIVAVARMLVVRLRALLIHQQPYCIGLAA